MAGEENDPWNLLPGPQSRRKESASTGAVQADPWKEVVEGAKFQQLKSRERLTRTRSLLESINPAAASAVLPKKELSAEEKAAIVCQKYIRAKLAKKEFAARLYQRFIQEEEERDRKQQEQMEEGETLLSLRRLEREVEEQAVVVSNKQRQRNDAASRIQRAWRQYKGYVYFEYEDWERARVNPFSSVVPVETTSAFSSPAGPYLMGAPDDSHTDHYEDGEYEYTDDEDENVRRRDGPAGGPGDAYRLYDDWEMTPVHDREPLAIAHIEAQIQVMNMMQKAIEDHAPSSLNIEDEASEESGGEYYEDEDSEGEEDEDELEDEEEEENRYQHRSFDQKSFSALDLRHFSPAAKSEGAGKRRSLDHGPQSHAAAIMSQSVGDLYHICYDADGERISRSFSHDSKGSPECGTRRSPDGSSGNPSPTHDAAETGSHQSGRSANRGHLKLHIAGAFHSARGGSPEDSSKSLSPDAPKTPMPTPPPASARKPLASLVSTEHQYESAVLASKWKQRTLTEHHLERLTDIQLQCIANEFHLLIGNELVRQLEIRDDLVLQRDNLNAECSKLAGRQQKIRTEAGLARRKLVKPSGRRRFRFLSRKSA